MTYQIQPDVCIACGACEPECPEQAISEQGGVFVIDETKCKDHAKCVEVCPVGAPIKKEQKLLTS